MFSFSKPMYAINGTDAKSVFFNIFFFLLMDISVFLGTLGNNYMSFEYAVH